MRVTYILQKRSNEHFILKVGVCIYGAKYSDKAAFANSIHVHNVHSTYKMQRDRSSIDKRSYRVRERINHRNATESIAKRSKDR